MNYRIFYLYCLLFMLAAFETINAKDSYNNYSDTLKELIISGKVTSIFREDIENVTIVAKFSESEAKIYTDTFGLFKFILSRPDNESSVRLFFSHHDFRLYDTIVYYKKKQDIDNLLIQLVPKYKILFKGRVAVGHTLLEDVKVEVSHNDEVSQLVTLGCYEDEEKYWNCLYLGMFKTEVTAENPQDTIHVHLSKYGFKPKEYSIIFSEYSGDLMRFKIKYADSIPDLPQNNLNLKILYPFTQDIGWFISLGYLRQISFGNFKRVYIGGDIILSSFKYSDRHTTLPGMKESSFDSTYITGFIGPSVNFYLTRPDIRWFSSSIGSTFSISMDRGEFVFQPYFGTRIFLDMRKSITFEVRYFSYHEEITRYNFKYLGNAEPYSDIIIKNRIICNLGLQINF